MIFIGWLDFARLLYVSRLFFGTLHQAVLIWVLRMGIKNHYISPHREVGEYLVLFSIWYFTASKIKFLCGAGDGYRKWRALKKIRQKDSPYPNPPRDVCKDYKLDKWRCSTRSWKSLVNAETWMWTSEFN